MINQTNEDKQIFNTVDSEIHIRKGVNAVCDAVSVTMGSDGKYVIIGNKNKNPNVTKDGVTVARQIQLEHHVEDCAAKLVIDGCMRTLYKLGDGTTSTAVQIRSLVNSIYDARKNGNINMRKFLQYMNELRDIVIESMELDIIKDVTLMDLINVATISANNDSVIGEIIGNVYHKIGESGIINVNYKDIKKIEVKFNEGYVFESGLTKKEFINSGANCVLKDPLMLVSNRNISKVDEIMKFMDYCYKNNRPLLVIASGYSEEVMSTILKNVGSIQICPILAPSTGDMKNSYLEDICKVSGALFINGEEDIFFEDIISKYDNIESIDERSRYMEKILGTVKSSIVSKDSVELLHSSDLSSHISYLKNIIDGTDDDLITEFTKKRLAFLESKVVEISFPILTATENSFNNDRYDDSFKATLSALKNGISVGGGKSYINAYNTLNSIDVSDKPKEYVEAINVIKECMISILITSLDNGDYSDEEIKKIVSIVSESENRNFGYNTVAKEFEDLVKSGVVESGISAQTCFSNAFSIASVLTNVGCSITHVPSIF